MQLQSLNARTTYGTPVTRVQFLLTPRRITVDNVMNKNYTERKSNLTEKLIQHGWIIALYDGHSRVCTSIVRFAALGLPGCMLVFSKKI